MLGNVENALARLAGEDRVRSYYVSKMIAVVAVGLFDAALNYLWDETVSSFPPRVAGYDLGYFFDLAVSSPDRRKQLSTVEDLARVDDVDLLRACREIGLISAVGHAQLDHIRYMRNYASAAHPNQVELTGLQLAQRLETYIRRGTHPATRHGHGRDRKAPAQHQGQPVGVLGRRWDRCLLRRTAG